MAPDDSPAAVGAEPGGRAVRSVAMSPELWKDNLRQLYEGETLRSVLRIDVPDFIAQHNRCVATGAGRRACHLHLEFCF